MQRVACLLLFTLSHFVGGIDDTKNDDTCGNSNSCPPEPTWNLLDNHPCNIDVKSPEDFASEFPDGFPALYEKPIILRDPQRNKIFQELSSRDNAPLLFDGGVTKLPEANLYSWAKTEVSVKDFVNSPEVTSWDEADKILYMLTTIEDFSAYVPPPGLGKVVDTRLGIGSFGSGVQWHDDGPGFCELMHGRKHWVLTQADKRPFYDHKRPSRHWFEYMFSDYKGSKIWECTLQPGDAIYFPNRWFHTTVNLDAYTSFVTTFYEVWWRERV